MVRDRLLAPDELDLEFDLIVRHRRATNRALGATAGPAPDTVGPSGGYIPGEYDFAGFVA
jgi:hypothetical protein